MEHEAEEKKATMGRPRKEIEYDHLEKLCAIQATELEICEWYGVCEDTLNTRCKEHYDGLTFSEVYKIYSADGKISLRRLQWQSANKGNVGMQIWLGKQVLGQRERQEIEHQGDVKINIIPVETGT